MDEGGPGDTVLGPDGLLLRHEAAPADAQTYVWMMLCKIARVSRASMHRYPQSEWTATNHDIYASLMCFVGGYRPFIVASVDGPVVFPIQVLVN